MKSLYLKQKFRLIKDSLKKVKNANLSDPQLSSMLSSYLVVFISGIYEDCIESLFVQRAAKSQDKEVENLVKVFLHKHFRNPEYKRIKELVKALDPKHGKTLKSNIPKKSIDGIDSIVSNKNNVAHGQSSNATIKDVIQYHASAIRIFQELENILL